MKRIALSLSALLCFFLIAKHIQAAAPLSDQKTIGAFKWPELKKDSVISAKVTRNTETTEEYDGEKSSYSSSYEMRYEDRVLEIGDNGQPTVFHRDIKSEKTKWDENGEENSPMAGRHFEWRREDGKWKLEKQGSCEEGKKLEDLDENYVSYLQDLLKNETDEAYNMEPLILPTKSAKAGDTWKADFSKYKPWSEVFGESEEMLKPDPEKSKAEGKLEKFDGDIAFITLDYDIQYFAKENKEKAKPDHQTKGKMLLEIDRKTMRTRRVEIQDESSNVINDPDEGNYSSKTSMKFVIEVEYKD